MKLFKKPNYEIGTAPFEDIAGKYIRYEQERYKGSFFKYAVKAALNRTIKHAIGIGFDGDWSVKVDEAADTCLVWNLCAKYGINMRDIPEALKGGDRALDMKRDIVAYKKGGNMAAKMFADNVNGTIAEEVSHSLGFRHKEDSCADDKQLNDLEKDYAFFWNFANLENFNSRNTIDVGD